MSATARRLPLGSLAGLRGLRLTPRQAARLRALRDGLILAGLLFLAYLFLVLAPGARTVGLDAYAYWSLDLADLYGRSQGAVLGPGAFRYSPVIAQLVAPFTALPWGSFLLLYEALLLGTIVWLGGRRPLRVLAILAFPPVAIELYYGNVHLLMAAAVVLGFRHPWTWAFVLLTKVTPGVGLIWFAVRREWRQLLVVTAVTGAVVLGSLALAPGLWLDWLGTLVGNRAVATTNSVPVPLLARLPLAIVLVAWGARTDRPWTVPVAVTLAMPVVWIHGLATLAGVVPLLGPGRNSYVGHPVSRDRTSLVSGDHVSPKGGKDVIHNLVRRLKTDEGQGLAEYALILALIAVVCIVGTAFFGQQVNDTLSIIGSTIDSVT
jgi:Flp pilus assembly pilin Flp